MVNFFRNNRGGVSLSIGIFVVLLIVLIITSIFYFITRDNRLNEVLDESLVLDDVNTRVAFLNYFLDRIFEKAVERSDSQDEFIREYNLELEKYKFGDEYFIKGNKFYPVVDSVEFENGKLVLEIDVKISFDKELSVDYEYTLRFVSDDVYELV